MVISAFHLLSRNESYQESGPCISLSGRILLANSEASKFRLAFHFFEGTKAWKKLGGHLGFIAGK
jgi:hypothetical protein